MSPQIPRIIGSAAAGNYEELTSLVKGNQGPSSMAWGLRYSVWCADEAPFEDPERIGLERMQIPPERPEVEARVRALGEGTRPGIEAHRRGERDQQQSVDRRSNGPGRLARFASRPRPPAPVVFQASLSRSRDS